MEDDGAYAVCVAWCYEGNVPRNNIFSWQSGTDHILHIPVQDPVARYSPVGEKEQNDVGRSPSI